jgi:hypothetical protein
VKIYRSVAENWITPTLGELQVRHLTAGRLDSYFRNDVPPTRFADVRNILHAFVKGLVVQGALARDPVDSLQSCQRKGLQKRSEDREVTTDDLKTVLAAIEEWMNSKRPGAPPTASTAISCSLHFVEATSTSATPFATGSWVGFAASPTRRATAPATAP